MKAEYRMYGRDSEPLSQKISESDKKILNGYLRFCATTANPQKVNDYRRYMLQFMDVLEKPLDKITREDAIDFWALVNHSVHEDNTKIMMRRTVKRFLRWHYRDLDMIESLKNPRGPLVNPRKINKAVLFKPEEIKLMLRAAERIRDKALFMLLAETGARPQEIRDLKWADINWDDKEVHLYSTKTARDRDLPIYHSYTYMKQWYDEWVYSDPQDDDFIFPAMAAAHMPRNKPISTSYINRIINVLAKKAGIKRRVTTYLLRHSRLTELYKLGVKGIEHNKFAGHSPGSRHQNVYVHLDNKDLKQSLLKNVYGEEQANNILPNNTQGIHAMYQKQMEMMQMQIMQLQQMMMVQSNNKQSISVDHS